MGNIMHLTRLLSMLACLYPVSGFTQEDQTAPPPDASANEASTDSPADQEVEVNEDNYRQFMELKGALQERTVVPEDSYQSRAGLQKLDELPEASQKHLRNQLREIIVQGDAWQPGDEDTDYPYVPSEAASTNPALQKQEAEAWGELVDNYHAREAEIYANSSRSSAAAAAGRPGPAGDQAGNGEGQRDAGEQSVQPGGSETAGSKEDNSADSYSPNSANDPGAQSTAGVSQSAMEYLQNSQQAAAGADGINAQSPGGESMQAEENAQEPGQPAQQSPADQKPPPGAAMTQSSPDRLDRDNSQANDTPEGVSQNALEYLTGDATKGDQETEDTLTIEDLINAQGLDAEVKAGAAVDHSADKSKSDEKAPDKDGDG